MIDSAVMYWRTFCLTYEVRRSRKGLSEGAQPVLRAKDRVETEIILGGREACGDLGNSQKKKNTFAVLRLA